VLGLALGLVGQANALDELNARELNDKMWSGVDEGGGCATVMMPLGKSERWMQIEKAPLGPLLPAGFVG
jgi:hypothetical protein